MCAVLATAVSDAKAVKIILNVSGVVTIVKSVAFALLSNNPHCRIPEQWGNPYCEGTQLYWRFPISFNRLFAVVEAHQVSVSGDFKTCSILNPNNNGLTLNSSANGYVANVIALGVN